MDRPIVACVLAGGTGTRLYPASRSHRPKQFLSLPGDRSLLSRSLERVAFADERYVLAPEPYVPAVREHAPDAEVLLEPAQGDTGPALVYAAWRLRDRFPEAVVLSLPSDHHVGDDEEFREALERAARVATETAGLVTLGVEPTRPATEYGYVVPDRGAAVAESGYAPVARFREKPNRETARGLCEQGAYWNAGIFAWTPEALLREARESPLGAMVEELEAGNPNAAFDAVDPVSVDYAILERTERAYVTPLATPWDDLGTWDALGRVLAGEGGNVALEGEVLSIDATGNVVAAPETHVSLVGVEDLVVAAFDDRVLVVPREDAGRVREVVAELRRDGRF